MLPNSIYLDHAATTPLNEGVLERMMPFLEDSYGNPSSVHAFGRRARAAVEETRDLIADVFGVRSSELIFTSGGTESNNLALSVLMSEKGPDRLVTSSAEHDSIFRTAEHLREKGIDVSFMPASESGSARLDSLRERVTGGKAMVSLMHTNNETGALNDLENAYRIVSEADAVLHSDCVQSVPFYDAKTLILRTDMMSVSGHKLGGPKGTGLLYVSAELPTFSLVHGGGQEQDRRSGTENVAGIVGLGEAIRLASLRSARDRDELRTKREFLRQKLRDVFGSSVRFTTPVEDSAPHILHALFSGFSPEGLDAEMLILGLDMEGVHVSAGSACSSGAVSRSHVLTAMHVADELAGGAVRFSLSFGTTREEIVDTVERTLRVLRRLESVTGL